MSARPYQDDGLYIDQELGPELYVGTNMDFLVLLARADSPRMFSVGLALGVARATPWTSADGRWPHLRISRGVNTGLGGLWDARTMRFLMICTRLRLLLPILLVGSFGLEAGVVAFGQTPQPPATIMLIRHAEKPAEGMDLSPVGFERAKVIPKLFGGAGAAAPHNLPKPDLLFATHVGKNSNREVETIIPLSAALGLPISHDIMDKDFATLAKELLSGRYAGKVVLVAWHHGSLPAFAKALGAVPPYDPWPDTQFDRVWRIDYVGGKAKLTDLPQGLMPGDSK